MLSRISAIGLALAMAASFAVVRAQDAPGDSSDPKPETRQAAAPAKEPVDGSGKVVRKAGEKEQVKHLNPKDVAAELKRLKSKADIKAEVHVRTTSGRPVSFKGVIRNGKLIERIIDKRFVPQKDVEHTHSGVRLWWSGGSDGYIFFRYANIKTLSIIGRLTDAERREIMRRLKAKREGKGEDAGKPNPNEAIQKALEKMNPDELKAYLLRQYPYESGWDHKRQRALKRKELIENKVLSREEAIFVKYFSILVEARFETLNRNTKKIEIEPGSEDSDSPEDGTSEPARGGQPPRDG
jgi:hypothetical protein